MRVFCLKTLAELAPYADDWDRLAAGVPFRSWTWLSHWWRHYGPLGDADGLRTSLAVLCLFDDADALVGIAPWYLDCSAMRGRVLRSLGSGEVCSDYLGVLCQPTREEAVVGALADYLVENALDDGPDALRWDLLELDGVDAGDRPTSALADDLAAARCSVHRQANLSCWRLELPTSWESYFASLGKHLRRDARRLERELQAKRVTLRAATRLDELPRALDILVDLHQRRRKALGERGCFASPRFLAFHRDVLPELLRRGMVQLYWLEFEGRPAAAEYHLAGGGVLYVYQSGMEPELLELKPGYLINLMIVRQAIERGYRAYDFLRGDEPYKARLGARQRPGVKYRIVPPRAAAQLRHNLWQAGRNVKNWMTTRIKRPEDKETGRQGEDWRSGVSLSPGLPVSPSPCLPEPGR
jgi:CelD/BcsL family acetyltransferase involved in cellulose biosynthesis